MTTLRKLALAVAAAAVVSAGVWWVTWHVVYGDNQGSRTIWIQDDSTAPVRTMELRLAPKLPTSRHVNYTTLGGIIRTNLRDALERPELHYRILQHEAWHGHQQGRWVYWGLWLAWYGASVSFRNNQEAGARAHEGAPWPRLSFARAPP